jgi:hypothetical protein
MLSFYVKNPYRPFCSFWWEETLGLPWRLLRGVKYFWQRGVRGWADCDTWSLDKHLNTVLSGAIRHLKNTNHGFPFGMASDEWDRILEAIAWGFEAGNRKEDFDWNSPEYNKLEEAHRKALALFVEHYGSLWD